jgi:hypothetical protein
MIILFSLNKAGVQNHNLSILTVVRRMPVTTTFEERVIRLKASVKENIFRIVKRIFRSLSLVETIKARAAPN